MPYGRNIYAKAYDMVNSIICEYPQSYYTLPHWKCFMRCCAKCPSINLPDQETDDQYTDTIPSIRFHIYHIILCYSTHGRLLLPEK